jgi:hypothetical protein
MSRGEYQPRHHEHQQEDRVKQALQTLEQGIDAIVTEECIRRPKMAPLGAITAL